MSISNVTRLVLGCVEAYVCKLPIVVSQIASKYHLILCWDLDGRLDVRPVRVHGLGHGAHVEVRGGAGGAGPRAVGRAREGRADRLKLLQTDLKEADEIQNK